MYVRDHILEMYQRASPYGHFRMENRSHFFSPVLRQKFDPKASSSRSLNYNSSDEKPKRTCLANVLDIFLTDDLCPFSLIL